MSLKLYLTTNMISVTDTMIVQVYKRPQNACLVTLTCLQHPPCSPGGVRVQNPCMLKVCSHSDTPTKSAVDEKLQNEGLSTPGESPEINMILQLQIHRF